MADIAELGFSVKTDGLTDAKEKLEAVIPAAEKVDKATDKLEKILGELAKATGNLVKATDKLAISHKATGDAAGSATKATEKLNDANQKAAEAAQKATDANAKLEKQLEKTAAVKLRDIKAEAEAFRARTPQIPSGIRPMSERTPEADAARRAGISVDEWKAQAAAMREAERAKASGAKASDTLAKSEDDLDASTKKTTASSETLGSVLVRVARGFLAVFAVKNIIDFLNDATASMAKLGETSKLTGIDLQRLQAIQAVGVQNGLGRQQTNDGLQSLAEKLNEARYTETELGRLLAENNLKLKDRQGQVIGTNEALSMAAKLIQNANTEFDKIKIAEAFGLTKDWVKTLEQGPEALEKSVDAAENAGGAIDKGMVQRAEDFRRDWAVAVDKWVTMFQSAAGPILKIVDAIVDGVVRAAGVLGQMANYVQGAYARQDIEKNGIEGASNYSIRTLRDRARAEGRADSATGALRDRFNALDDEDVYSVPYDARPSGPLSVTVNGKPRGGGTNVNSLYNKAGGGGGGKSESDRFDDIETRAEVRLEKLRAEREAIGLTAEATAKLKYETDLLGQAKKADIELTPQQTERLKALAAEMAKTETSTKTLKNALDFGKELTKGFLSDFIDGIKNGQSVFESFGKAALNVLNKIGDKLINMAVDGLFSSSGSGGGIGGLIAGFGKMIFGGGSALGNVFGSVEKYAKGGAFTNRIYSKPTFFEYANGGAFGVMGEAGPEAVMPLKRGPNGSLGVQMYGGNGPSSGSANQDNSLNVSNTFNLEGVVDKDEMIARIEQGVDRSITTARRQMPTWINQYNTDGAIV